MLRQQRASVGKTVLLLVLIIVCGSVPESRLVAAPFAIYGITLAETIDAPNTGSLETRPVSGPFVWRDFQLPGLLGWDATASKLM